jgi:IS5 family transposase
MVKLLVLQQWIGLSDPELEKQALNRLDFQRENILTLTSK